MIGSTFSFEKCILATLVVPGGTSNTREFFRRMRIWEPKKSESDLNKGNLHRKLANDK